ncbi:MAG TPA: ATP synthase subunit C [Candidatus Omnitrophota bacterium]|nr:ATP synthase subunit C [Candidatus Omnitrophota bacterium]HRZ14576.1 ATP synthase subunit C [Candidatus Omnitrophota bacterium]
MKVTKRGAGVVLLTLIMLAVALCGIACAQEAQSTAMAKDPQLARWAFIAAALSTGLSALAGGIAVAYVGSAAVGAVSEKPEVSGKVLLYVGLAEGIAIYGLIIAIMILIKV